MKTFIDDSVIPTITKHFQALSSFVPLHPIRNGDDYDYAVAVLNHLLDRGAADENHPLADLVATLGELIGDYDDTHFPSDVASPPDVLRFLMTQHTLSQSDLPEIGTQGVVSEILNGKRDLNVGQIKALSARFGVGATAFI